MTETNKLIIIKGKPEGKKAKFDEKKSEYVIEICFNPTEYSVDKNITFSEASIPGLDSPIIQFSSGKAKTPCKVVWGSLEFVGVLDSMKKRYILFLDGGIPVRARVTLSFKEYIPVEIQIKKSPRSSPDRLKKYVIKEGDSLWQLSYKEYGEPYYWRIIAEANKIDNPILLEPGKEIDIPPKIRG